MSAPTRRMRIDDFELMGHARRVYLEYLEERESSSLDPSELRIQKVLREDTRLEGPLFMDWELREEFDRALVVALRFLEAGVETELADQSIPPGQLPRYVEGRRAAIRRTMRALEKPDDS
ncbi:MAG: hypothetical protein ACE5F1_00665 [Planctomycetota bacterium]